MSTTTHYRIIDESDNSIVADISNYTQAYETLLLYSQDYPDVKFTIETYTVSSVRPGFGRDPDLH